jgi:hypothetical protein
MSRTSCGSRCFCLLQARTPAEAVQAYRARISRVLSCLTTAHVDVGGGYAPSAIPHALIMAGNDAVALRGASRLTLAVSEHYTIKEDSAGWQVQRAAYFYAIGLHDSGELLAYHWHPHGKSPVVDPHLHVRANIQLGERWLGKVHLPTGAIKLEDIVSLAVNELAVKPLREDWELLLNENRT